MTSGLVTPAVQSRPTGVGQVLVVANPAAAGVTTAVVTAVLDRLAADASGVRPFLTTAPGSAAQALRLSQFRVEWPSARHGGRVALSPAWR